MQIRVEAAGLNFRDVLNVLGLYPGDPGRIGGGDLSGIVTELGAGVTGFEVGQRVFGFMPGSFCHPGQCACPVPVAGAERGQRGRGGDHTRRRTDDPACVRLGEGGAR